MTTALTLNMPIGSRAIRFPAVNARAPGRRKRRRYGVRCGMPPPSPGGDQAVQHLFRADSRTWVVGPALCFFIQRYGEYSCFYCRMEKMLNGEILHSFAAHPPKWADG
ncbi:hypothetical protein GCM10010270_23660 [Streptomyces violaceus]|nr:hypothetical protein GCM10010270_23660 [Streptomyces janthinus]